MNNLFQVYPIYDVTIVKGRGAQVWDDENHSYLDFYGGHGVISIGHMHPKFVQYIKDQLEKIAFYSNSIKIPIQEKLAQKIAQISGYNDYNLFMCNSGAEAIENALKLASFHTGKTKVVAFRNSYHGRTAGALSITDDKKIFSPLNYITYPIEFLDLNNQEQVEKSLKNGDVAAVIIEGIQGLGGLNYPTNEFLQFLEAICNNNNVMLILDEIQSGYGRSGRFFAHQFSGIKADLITIAKGMGNGFPVAGVLINPKIEAKYGMLGTTFGGNHLACVAALSVVETIKEENLIPNVHNVSAYLNKRIKEVDKIKEIKGKGLMFGIKFDFPIKELRRILLFEHHIFTGMSYDPNLIRILPPLCINEQQIDEFIEALKLAVHKV